MIFCFLILPSGRGCVDYVAFALTQTQFLLLLARLDTGSYIGNYSLDTYQMFSVVGFSAKGSLVPVAYIYICGSGSNTTWTRARAFVQRAFSTMGCMTSVASDVEKGTAIRMERVFGSNCLLESSGS